jgi:hypothetical protein
MATTAVFRVRMTPQLEGNDILKWRCPIKAKRFILPFSCARSGSVSRFDAGLVIFTANNNKQNSVLYRHQLVDKGEVAY